MTHLYPMRSVRIFGVLLAAALFPAFAGTAAGATHTVGSGDTLSGIAARYHVSVKALQAANGIRDADAIRAGQKLAIPSAAPAAPPPAARKPAAKPPAPPAAKPSAAASHPTHALPADVKKRLDAQPVTRGKWKYIVIHHSATSEGTMKSMDEYHRRVQHMENGLAYHFVIGNGRGIPDGRVEMAPRWRKQIKGGHVRSDAMNEKAIGICLVGDFSRTRPTAGQMKALYGLVQYLEARCGIPAATVRTHRAINTRPTECPGALFPTKTLYQNI